MAVPDLSIQVVLESGYAPPALSVQVVLQSSMIPVTLEATLPAPSLTLTLTGSVEILQRLTLAANLPAPSLTLTLVFTGEQNLDLPDADGTSLDQPYQQALATANPLLAEQQMMAPAQTALRMPIAAADPIRVTASLLHQAMLPTRNRVSTREAHGLIRGQGAGVPHTETIKLQHELTERYAHGLPIQASALCLDAETIKTRNRLTGDQQSAWPVVLRLIIGQQQALPTATRIHALWTQMIWPDPGRWWPFYIVPALSTPIVLQPNYSPRALHCRVILRWDYAQQPYCVGFDPNPEPSVIAVPILETYVVINTFTLKRADTMQSVAALDFQASLDADSFTWTWNATVPANQMSLVRGAYPADPVELIATLNGTALRIVVERLIRSRQFGNAAIKISGRGRAAWLSDPYSPIQTLMNTEVRTAQQLLNDALMINGVPIGWTVDWQVNDWSVPAGLWSHTGTYISAATRLAESAGGYVQADPSLQTLRILPYYPVAPWLWSLETPDIGLPEAVCHVEEIEWQDKPGYNAVWVVGAAQGRRDLVKRTGTAGDRSAPTVVDPLATDTIMTRQRGLRVIADTGRQAHISLKLPVLSATGIIRPGRLIQYTEQGVTYRGLSRAVSVNYQFPQAWQTIKVETHELEPV